MGRLDFESGRFDSDYETSQIQSTLRGWQSEFGDSVLYYRFWGDHSQVHEIWDEPTENGRVFHPAQEVNTMHTTIVEGGEQGREEGFYYNDDLYATCSFDQLTRLGLTDLDVLHFSYLRDRLVYNSKVFRVTGIQVTGQIQRRDIMASIEGTQMRPDELSNDPQFAKFANVTTRL